MKLTDEMVEKVTRELCLAEIVTNTNRVRRTLAAYHRILSSTEPDDELIDRVEVAIEEADLGGSGEIGTWRPEARAAIRAIFGGE